MAMKRVRALMIASASLLIAGNLALAREQGQGKGGPPDKDAKEHGKAHKHVQKSGHDMLGQKLKQDGKHEVGKLANRSVTAEVKNGKVRNMAAGDLAMKRVKTKMKMAGVEGGLIPAAWGGSLQFAQYYDDYYYGYCFDDGYDFTCYWYPASEVDYIDYTWEDYDPYY